MPGSQSGSPERSRTASTREPTPTDTSTPSRTADPSNTSTSTWLIGAGALLGLGCGLFFGEYCGWLQGLGEAYVGLLQMTVLPFVTLSLIANVGRLSLRQGGRLAAIAAAVLLLLCGIGLFVLTISSWSFPPWKSGSFYSTSLLEKPQELNWTDLFIPSNPFWSLTNNVVPAVVVFSIGLGAAISGIGNKNLLLDQLDVFVQGLSRLAKLVLRVSPIGIFAIVAHASGTLSWQQFALLQGYLLTYGLAACLVAFWLLPALVSSFTPLRYRDIMALSRDAMFTAFIVGNTFVVLPMIIESAKALMAKYGLESDQKHHTPEFVIPMAYSFPDIGRIVGLVFIPFAAWFYGSAVSPELYPRLLGVGFLGAFAKPVVTMPLLLSMAHIPADIFNLYLSVGVVAARFGDLMKVMHLLAFGLLTGSWLGRRFKLDPWRLALKVLVTFVLCGGCVATTRAILFYGFEDAYSKERLIALREPRLPTVHFVLLEPPAPPLETPRPGELVVQRIQRRGILRVGFAPNAMPFSYFNRNGDLVGFDVEMVHQMARDLNVTLEFVPFEGEVISQLQSGQLDMAIGGLEGTVARAAVLPHARPYMNLTASLVVADYRKSEFQSLSQIKRQPHLKLAVVANSLSADNWIRMLRDREGFERTVVVLNSEKEFFDSRGQVADALVTSLEVGSAWTLIRPEFAVVKPEGMKARVPLYYLTPSDSNLEEFLETWQALKELDGTVQTLYDYWILGEGSAKGEPPRWCVIRDVLHWVD